MRSSRLNGLWLALFLSGPAWGGALAELQGVAAAGLRGGRVFDNAPAFRGNLVGPAGFPGSGPAPRQEPFSLQEPKGQERKEAVVPDPEELAEANAGSGGTCRGAGACLLSALKTPFEVLFQGPVMGGVIGKDVGLGLLGTPGAILGGILGALLGAVAAVVLAPISLIGGLYKTVKEIV